eukprot:CAMPEP_0201505904 /NCGR_PEP_ID=MMETSP0151_2-20130828/86047_1 /ASSEMBLY_ACC=CAM_ASM_000257 /TAXON_ID=200890 /ORGANISM="Paramoeba atlantica, Strain 621/1 / CCAP 1560/9" /LENGTH=150 /DNA_ID=CAMNT_0047899857 /DNA_START=811 /DNA_END=1264 /DNA_ORIENTATION=-
MKKKKKKQILKKLKNLKNLKNLILKNQNQNYNHSHNKNNKKKKEQNNHPDNMDKKKKKKKQTKPKQPPTTTKEHTKTTNHPNKVSLSLFKLSKSLSYLIPKKIILMFFNIIRKEKVGKRNAKREESGGFEETEIQRSLREVTFLELEEYL